MFKHGMTGKIYYSVREKINYYKAVIAGKKEAPAATKRKAKGRLRTLERLNARTFDEPTLIVTDDKHFGNGLHKPRAVAVIDSDDKGKLLVVGIHHRTTNEIILDKDPSRQISGRKVWIDRADVYENKSIPELKHFTQYDKEKIKEILRKK